MSSRLPIRTASVSDFAELTGTKIPYSASVSSVGRGPIFRVKISIGPALQSVATTGQPKAIASISAFGNPSAFEEETNRRAALTTGYGFCRCRRGVGRN